MVFTDHSYDVRRDCVGKTNLVLALVACDVRWVVRTTLRTSAGEMISQSCVREALDASGQWDLKQQDGASLAVVSRSRRPSLNLNISTENGTRSSLSLLATVLVGIQDELKRLRDIESAERDVATTIAAHCAPHATLSCWDSKADVESPKCFP